MEGNTFILTVEAEMFGLITVIHLQNTSLKIVMAEAFGEKNNMNVLPLSNLHSLDVKMLCGEAHYTQQELLSGS